MLDLPLEYALIKFKGNKLSGKIVPELLDLADKGIVRFVDIVFIQKEKDGNTRTVELNDIEQAAYEMFVPIGNHVSSLFTEQDLEIAAGKLPKNSAAALLLWRTCGLPTFVKPSWMQAALSYSAARLRLKWSRSSKRNWPQKRRRNQRRRKLLQRRNRQPKRRQLRKSSQALDKIQNHSKEKRTCEEIPLDLSAALAVVPIPPDLSVASDMAPILPDPSAVLVVVPILLDPLAASDAVPILPDLLAAWALDAATNPDCCVSSLEERHDAAVSPLPQLDECEFPNRSFWEARLPHS